jgi:prolyl oligopeptidase
MKQFEYPETSEEKLTEEIHDVEVEDNFRWLEELESEKVKEWVKVQNNFTDEHIPKELVEKYKRELKDFIYYEREGPRKVRGNKEFYYKVGKADDLFVIIMKDLVSKEEKIIIDPHKWSDDHTDTLFGFFPSPNCNYLVHDKVLGGDEWASSLHILDIKTGEYLDKPIQNTRLANVSWKEEEGFFYTRYPDKNEASGDQLYTERNVFYHKIGTDISEDKLIYRNEDPQAFTFIKPTLDNKNCLILVQKGWLKNDILLYRIEIDRLDPICKDIEATFTGNVVGKNFIGLTDYLAPKGKVFEIDLDNLEVDNWETLIPEGEYPIDFFDLYGGKILVRYLEESYNQLYIYELDGTKLGKVELPFIGSMLYFEGGWDKDEFYYLFTSYLHPYTVLKTNIETLETEIVSQPEIKVEVDEFKTELKWYESRDGTKIPMFLTMKKDIKLDSNNPVLLYGYGGFKASNVPYYYPRNFFLLTQGFILAYPSIRGGIEFGEKWHLDGMKENKQNVFDDFIAAAEWLIENKYTQTKLLTIEGASNGGLLTGAAVVQRPDLFGNVLIEVPVLDMVRFHKFYNAQPWMIEYGNPDIEDEFKFLFEYSPYHKVDQNEKYPSILLTTNINDKRVHPMHAFKMTARLQKIEKNNPILLRTITKAGHGVVSREQHVTESAEIAAFIMWRSKEEI